MRDDCKNLLRTALMQSLPLLRELSAEFQEPYWVWRKEDGWRGRCEARPCLSRIFGVASSALQGLSVPFADAFFNQHPEYAEGHLTSCGGLAAFQLGHDRAYPLSPALLRLWAKYSTFACSEC